MLFVPSLVAVPATQVASAIANYASDDHQSNQLDPQPVSEVHVQIHSSSTIEDRIGAST